MNSNYIRNEIKKDSRYQYIFEQKITPKDIIDFYSKIEESNYFEYFSYTADIVADSYEDSKYSFRSIHDIDESFFNNWSLGCINMIGTVDSKRLMVDTIHVEAGKNDLVVTRREIGNVLDVVESSFPRQKTMK